MGSQRRSSREDKRRRIIDAAVDVFAQKGFYGAKISEIAAAAQVADGTIYLYFRSKDDLLISLFEEKMGEIVRRLQALLNAEDDPEARMRAYIIGHLKLVAEQPNLMQVLTIELRQSARFIKEHSPKAFMRYLALISSILDDGQKKNVFRPELETPVFRRALFGAIDEISREWVLRGRDAGPPPDPERTGRQIADFVIRGLKAGGPAV